MSGNFDVWNADAPGGLNETAQQVQDGLASAQSVTLERQTEAGRFIVEYGGAVLPGHATVDGRRGVEEPTPMTGDVWNPSAT